MIDTDSNIENSKQEESRTLTDESIQRLGNPAVNECLSDNPIDEDEVGGGINHSPEVSQGSLIEITRIGGELSISMPQETELARAVGHYLPENLQTSITKDLRRLHMQRENTVASTRERGELSDETAKQSSALEQISKINTDTLTVKQTNDLFHYVQESTPLIRHQKGGELLKIMQAINSRDFLRSEAFYRYSPNQQIRWDEMYDYGHIGSSDFDYRQRQELSRAYNIAVDAYNDAANEFNSRIRKQSSMPQKPTDPFTANLGRITEQYIQDRHDDNLHTEDDYDIMHGRDLGYIDTDEETDYSYEFDNDDELVYDMFPVGILEIIDDNADFRQDMSSQSDNSLYYATLKEIYHGNVTNAIDEIDLNFIENLISENRLNAKSVASLATATLQLAVASQENNPAQVKILSVKLKKLICELMSLDPKKTTKFSTILDKINSRSEYNWKRCDNAKSKSKLVYDTFEVSLNLMDHLSVDSSYPSNVNDPKLSTKQFDQPLLSTFDKDDEYDEE